MAWQHKQGWESPHQNLKHTLEISFVFCLYQFLLQNECRSGRMLPWLSRRGSDVNAVQGLSFGESNSRSIEYLFRDEDGRAGNDGQRDSVAGTGVDLMQRVVSTNSRRCVEDLIFECLNTDLFEHCTQGVQDTGDKIHRHRAGQ